MFFFEQTFQTVLNGIDAAGGPMGAITNIAITVHKAQGSQFKRVIVPVTWSRLLDRTLIYTALTRGIEQVVFIGDRNAFDRAIIATPQSQERQVGFSV